MDDDTSLHLACGAWYFGAVDSSDFEDWLREYFRSHPLTPEEHAEVNRIDRDRL